jgi:hypothetical protein
MEVYLERIFFCMAPGGEKESWGSKQNFSMNLIIFFGHITFR